MDEEGYYHIELPIEGIRLIHTGLSQAVERWPGGDAEEQIDLIMMRDNFYKIMLEHKFENM